MYEDLRKAADDDPMSFTFDELLNWAQPLKMVVDHRNMTPKTMEVLQNEWKAKCLVRNAAFHRAIEIKRLKRKLVMLTKASDDTAEQKIELEASDDAAEQKIELEMEITRLESENLEERTQRKKEEEKRNKEEAWQQEEEKDRMKDERERKRAKMELEEEAQRVAKTARDRKRAEKEAEKVAKAAERNFVRTFLEAEEVALEHRRQERDRRRATWTAELDETITRMRADGFSFAKIASRLCNDLKKDDIKYRWNRHLNA
jgi:hypothetical protein